MLRIPALPAHPDDEPTLQVQCNSQHLCLAGVLSFGFVQLVFFFFFLFQHTQTIVKCVCVSERRAVKSIIQLCSTSSLQYQILCKMKTFYMQYLLTEHAYNGEEQSSS